MIFGLRPGRLSIQSVESAWNDRMAFFQPDRGEDLESILYLNNAKHFLIRWIHDNPNSDVDWADGDSRNPDQPTGVPRRPMPDAGSTAVAL